MTASTCKRFTLRICCHRRELLSPSVMLSYIHSSCRQDVSHPRWCQIPGKHHQLSASVRNSNGSYDGSTLHDRQDQVTNETQYIGWWDFILDLCLQDHHPRNPYFVQV